MRNMGKYIFLVIILSLLLTGCKDNNIDLDITSLTNDLLEAGVFDEELTEIDEGTVASLYTIDDVEEQQVYISNGATADEIAMFKAKDGDTADKIEDLLNQRIKAQIDVFESYAPEEVNKLENAILKKKGNYVIMVVSSKEEAEDIVNKYFK